jgi:hypothetical protein
MENQNSAEELHYMLGIVDQNIKKIGKCSNKIEVEGKAEGSAHDFWDSNNMRIEAEAEKSEPHRSHQNII